MKYDIVLADPPWQYKAYKKGGHGKARDHYHDMSIDEICALPIADILNNNAALFLWTTWPFIFDAERVIDEWGFQYKTIAWVWVKMKRSGFGFHFGMGSYTRANSEPCLLAIKGNMPVIDKAIQSIIYAPVRSHSQKPDDQYRKIESLYPDCNYLELFARKDQDNWDVWGNEMNGIDL